MKKVGLKIVNLIHDITRLGYRVSFTDDFNQILTVGFERETCDTGFYHHDHCGHPDGGFDRLEKDIIQSLARFYEEHKGEADEKK